MAVLALLFAGCRKTGNDWTFCNGCDRTVWLGTFSGSGNYYNAYDGNMPRNVPVTLLIDSLSGQTLKITVVSNPDFSWAFAGQKKDNTYYLTLAGSSQSLSLNLYQKSGAYKFTGTAKKFHRPKPDSVVLDASVSFEVLKEK